MKRAVSSISPSFSSEFKNLKPSSYLSLLVLLKFIPLNFWCHLLCCSFAGLVQKGKSTLTFGAAELTGGNRNLVSFLFPAPFLSPLSGFLFHHLPAPAGSLHLVSFARAHGCQVAPRVLPCCQSSEDVCWRRMSSTPGPSKGSRCAVPCTLCTLCHTRVGQSPSPGSNFWPTHTNPKGKFAIYENQVHRGTSSEFLTLVDFILCWQETAGHANAGVFKTGGEGGAEAFRRHLQSYWSMRQQRPFA